MAIYLVVLGVHERKSDGGDELEQYKIPHHARWLGRCLAAPCCAPAHMCTYVYMYAHMFMYVNIHVHMCTYVHMYADMCIYMYAHIFMYINMHLYVCTYVHMYAYMCTYAHMYAYTCACVNMYAYMCIYVNMHAYTCTYVHMYAYTCACVNMYAYMCTARSERAPLQPSFLAFKLSCLLRHAAHLADWVHSLSDKVTCGKYILFCITNTGTQSARIVCPRRWPLILTIETLPV